MTKREYTQLVQLHKKYHDKGLEILAFPCNQFGAQEPGTPQDIYDFATKKFGFPGESLTEKVDVNGDSAHPLWTYLKNTAPNTSKLPLAAIKWNFTKFLVDKSGNPTHRFEPATPAIEMSMAIEDLLWKASGESGRL